MYSVVQRHCKQKVGIVRSGIGARVQNPLLGGVDALMPHFGTAEKLRYLNYYYICLNNQSTLPRCPGAQVGVSADVIGLS